MATRTTVCPGCDEAVPGGHLSCPSCGYLLAEAPETGDTTSVAAGPPPAGAYIPPGAASSSASLIPARAWAGINAPTARPMATLGLAHAMAGATSTGRRAFSTEHAQTYAGTIPVQAHDPSDAVAGQAQGEAGARSNDVEAPWMETAAGWLMVVGAAVAILGFMLPWSRTVIGAEGVGTYFDTWGIANPSHALVVLGLAAALGLAVVANRIPTWIRTCCVGLLLGGLLIGLTWPYLFGPLGAGPGVIAILVGGVLLAGAGVLDLVEARHVPAAGNV